MNRLLELAEKSYVINLASRLDRLNSFKHQMDLIGYNNYEVFEAYGVDSEIPIRYINKLSTDNFKMTGWYGNKFSHYGVIEEAKTQGLKSVLIFEDDVYFIDNFDVMCEFAYDQLKSVSWDVINFGGNHRFLDPNDLEYPNVKDGLIPYTNNLSKIEVMYCLHAYLVKNTVYDFVLDNALQSYRSIDNFWGYKVYREFNSFCIRPAIAKQLPGFNNIGNTFCNYDKYID